MPKQCIARQAQVEAGRHKKWTRAVKQHQSNWKGPTANSLLCLKYSEQECFAIEGSHYWDAVGIPAKKQAS